MVGVADLLLPLRVRTAVLWISRWNNENVGYPQSLELLYPKARCVCGLTEDVYDAALDVCQLSGF